MDRQFRHKYRGEACVVVAGGPSVSDIDLRDLLPCRFIGVNVVNWLPIFNDVRSSCVAGVILDERLLLERLRTLVSTADYPVFTGNTSSDTDVLLRYLGLLGVHRIPSNHTEGFGDTFGRFSNGGNSGYAAIQLAVIMGFSIIGLVGFDGIISGRARRFHDDYEKDDLDPDIMNQWIGALDSCAALLRMMGVVVYNLSPHSQLTAFRKCTPIEWRRSVRCPEDRGNAPTADLLREEHGGCFQLPFRARALDPFESAVGTCFGGAINVADPGRYCPVPSFLEDALSFGENGVSLVRSSTERQLPSVSSTGSSVLDPTLLARAIDRLTFFDDIPSDIAAWLQDSPLRCGCSSAPLELRKYACQRAEECNNLDDSVLVGGIAAQCLEDLSNACHLLLERAKMLSLAINMTHFKPCFKAPELLAAVSNRTQILEYATSCEWLTITIRLPSKTDSTCSLPT